MRLSKDAMDKRPPQASRFKGGDGCRSPQSFLVFAQYGVSSPLLTEARRLALAQVAGVQVRGAGAMPMSLIGGR